MIKGLQTGLQRHADPGKKEALAKITGAVGVDGAQSGDGDTDSPTAFWHYAE